MMTINVAGKDVPGAYSCRARSPASDTAPVGEMVQNMLRNILQAGERKQDLLTFQTDRIKSENTTIHVPSTADTDTKRSTLVNGCKKRKLYQPQQHGALDIDQHNTLKNELLMMQEQLARMKAQYSRLYAEESGHEHDTTIPSPPKHRSPDHLSDPCPLIKEEKQIAPPAEPIKIQSAPPPPQYFNSEAFAAALKTEIKTSMTNLMDVIDRFIWHSTQLRTRPVKTCSYLENNINAMNLPPPSSLKHAKVSTSNIDRIAAVLYSSHIDGHSAPTPPEQNEALSLVVAPKKKRNKVTDSRTAPRTFTRTLGHESPNPDSPESASVDSATSSLPVSFPTSVAVPNPSLGESHFYSPYGSFYGHQQRQPRDSPPVNHSIFHSGLLAAVQQQQCSQRMHSPPEYTRSGSTVDGCEDGGSDCSGALETDAAAPNTSTLSSMHLRKAKLMFFWARYPSSNVLKMYFPDVKFNKGNTAQLVKWFSNFREYYYMQMEKHARTAIEEGIRNVEDLHVSVDSDIYRNLNQHYNRNNNIEVPSNFRYVIEQTLKEFFVAIQSGKDQEQSWKKPIYKVINRLDDNIPDYFKMPNFLEQLE